jgi:hypothetical protein
MLKFLFIFILFYLFRNINFLKENEESDGRFEHIHRLLKWNRQNQLIYSTNMCESGQHTMVTTPQTRVFVCLPDGRSILM